MRIRREGNYSTCLELQMESFVVQCCDIWIHVCGGKPDFRMNLHGYVTETITCSVWSKFSSRLVTQNKGKHPRKPGNQNLYTFTVQLRSLQLALLQSRTIKTMENEKLWYKKKWWQSKVNPHVADEVHFFIQHDDENVAIFRYQSNNFYCLSWWYTWKLPSLVKTEGLVGRYIQLPCRGSF